MKKRILYETTPEGVGYIKIDGQNSRHILVPSHNMPPLENLIREAVQRSDCYFLNEEAVAP